MRKIRLPLWALALLTAILTVLVVVLANQTAVDRIMAVTGLEKLLYPGGRMAPAVVQAPVPAPTILLEPAPAPQAAFEPAGSEDSHASAEPVPEAEPPLPGTPNTYRLYFLKLSPEGRLEPSGFIRELPAGSTPLAATLKALLLGPTLQDKAQGALSLIPQGTKLLSVRLKEGTALVSFSDEFEHNTSGLEGLAGQLREVVWTATQFPSVDAVQILINGQYRETLGEGGLTISAPLDRSNLP